MKYKNKKLGFSIIEIVVSVAIISIFFLVLFPILNINNRLNKTIYLQSIMDKNKGDIIKIIESSIAESEHYLIEKYTKNSIEVLQYKKFLSTGFVGKEIFQHISQKGNVLFIKKPILKNGRIINHFIIFCISYGSLSAYEGEYRRETLCTGNENILIDHVEGEFVKGERGVFINIKMRVKGKIYEIKGYENFKK